jgi:hypothetical protein
MKVDADGFSFFFTDAISAFVFDETDRMKPTFHGLPMKGVDIVAEFTEAYIYVEMKDYENPSLYDEKSAINDDEKKDKQACFKWLKKYLKYKYRDSYLYRSAEQKVDKPIHYLCLITFDNALNCRMQKALKQELPTGVASKRWKQEIARSCQVMNLDKWNESFPKWPVTRLPVVAPVGT